MDHPHNKRMMFVVLFLVLIIVAIVGFALVFNREMPAVETPTEQTPVVNEYDLLVEVTTAESSSTMDDPEVVELNQSTTAAQSSASGADREAFIQATSAVTAEEDN